MDMVMSEYKLVIVEKGGVIEHAVQDFWFVQELCEMVSEKYPDCLNWYVDVVGSEKEFKSWYAQNEAARFNFNGCTSSSDYLIKWLKEHKKQVLALYGVEE